MINYLFFGKNSIITKKIDTIIFFFPSLFTLIFLFSAIVLPIYFSISNLHSIILIFRLITLCFVSINLIYKFFLAPLIPITHIAIYLYKLKNQQDIT